MNNTNSRKRNSYFNLLSLARLKYENKRLKKFNGRARFNALVYLAWTLAPLPPLWGGAYYVVIYEEENLHFNNE
jgi:hypothetical protein